MALALITVAVAMAMSTFGQVGLGQGSSHSPSASASATQNSPAAEAEAPLPVPEGNTIVAVLDPTVEAPEVSAEQAVKLGRASMGEFVGQSPEVQLVRMTARNATSRLNGFTGWIILSTDVEASNAGGGYFPWLSPAPSVAPYATYTWVWVAIDGEVIGATQNVYASADQVPPLPE